MNINFNFLNNRPQATEGSQNANMSESVKRALIKSGLTEGSVFNGKIQDITGNSVKILLTGGDTLLATLENGSSFNIGEKINFLVKSNDGMKILLQPVDVAGEKLSQSLMNSLEQLGLEMNDRNVAMIKEMMAYGMPLDGSTLSDMERLVNSYPDARVEDIVTLNSHDIPVTPENLEQLKLYQSYEHKITENINNLAKELTQLSETNPELVKGIIDDIMKSMSETLTTEGSISASDNDCAENDNDVVKEAVQETGDKANENQSNAEIKNTVNKGFSQEGSMQLSSEDGNVVVRHNAETGSEGRQNINIQPHADENSGADKANTGKQTENINSGNMQDKSLQNANMQNENLQNENINPADKLQREIKEAVKELKSRWMLNADSLEEKNGDEIKSAVNEKLKTIYASAEKIMEALKNNGMEKTDTYKAAENMKNNMQFMNDFNHVASYVQVPYKTMSGEANGELFVYNRNKNKSLKDGPITAFLHLDMEYLGATDVRVSMDVSGKVSTKFSLSDTVSQDIVEEHLPELKKRLENQGYQVELSSEVIESKEPENPFEQIMNVDKPRSEVKRYGFDIRL